MNLPKPGPLVRAIWTDSGLHIDGWKTVPDVIQAARTSDPIVTTVGYRIHEDPDLLIIALSHDASHDMYYGAQVIYKTNLIEQRVIEEVNREAA